MSVFKKGHFLDKSGTFENKVCAGKWLFRHGRGHKFQQDIKSK